MFGIFKGSKTNAFHYCHAGEKGLVKQNLEKPVIKFLEENLASKSKPLTQEEYWFEYGKYFHSAAKSSYLVFDDTAYWALDLGHLVLLGFRENELVIFESPMYDDEDDDEPSAQYDIVYDSWDAIMENQQEYWKPCKAEEMDLIDGCMGWTEKLHNDMNDKYPMEKILSGEITKP